MNAHACQPAAPCDRPLPQAVAAPAPGACSSEVWGLQLVLSALGYVGIDGAPLVSNGRWGAGTMHALRAFQRAHGLHPADGVLDAATRAALVGTGIGRGGFGGAASNGCGSSGGAASSGCVRRA